MFTLFNRELCMLRIAKFVLFITAILNISCGKSRGNNMEQLPNEIEICKSLGFSEDVIKLIKTQTNQFSQFKQKDSSGNYSILKGIRFAVNNTEASKVINSLRDQLNNLGYQIFKITQNFNNGKDTIACIKSNDKFDILRVQQTDGINYDIDNDGVIKKIQEWDKQNGLIITGASYDWVECHFVKAPTDMMNFAKEVYKFCPDVVDQGTETVEELAKEMKNGNILYLWWD